MMIKIIKIIYEFIFWGTLAFAAVSDYRTKEVYDCIFWISALAGLPLLFSCSFFGKIVELVIFLVLQVLLFRRLYGGADCLAFGVCAVHITIHGGGVEDYLLHMLYTFILLAVVQLGRRNVNKKGNLKEPVALIPYIAATMLILEGGVLYDLFYQQS